MGRLNWELVRSSQLLSSNVDYTALPEKVLQFGEGNFLRGFVDWMVHEMNKKQLFNGRVVAIQPTPHGKVVPKLNDQDGLYTLGLRGIDQGEVQDKREIVASISRGINPYTDWQEVLTASANPDIQVVFSNTTEAGLKYAEEDFVPGQAPLSFPAKLAACLYHRYQVHGGNPELGWVVVPCELVENNGALLRDLVLRIADDWNLGEGFIQWTRQYNSFCNTLVDRIVTGFPKDSEAWFQELGYEDQLLVVGEPYHLFVIDGDTAARQLLPFEQAHLNVHWGDITPFRELKVRILNGAHTLMCPVGFLQGRKTVQETVNDPSLQAFIKQALFDEIFPVLKYPQDQKAAFAASVLERFRNPFNPHFLLDISLNSITKFKTRLLPTLVEYADQFDRVPEAITTSLACLICFYKGKRFEGGRLYGEFAGTEYPISESEDILQFFFDVWNSPDGGNVQAVVEKVLANESLWGTNLAELPGLLDKVQVQVERILGSC